MDEVLAEVGFGLVLGVYWHVDLTRGFIPLLSASDASATFGFGVSMAPFPPELLPDIAKWSEKGGAHVVLNGGEPCGRRLGEPLAVDLRLAVYKDVLCVRSKHPSHNNLSESEVLCVGFAGCFVPGGITRTVQ